MQIAFIGVNNHIAELYPDGRIICSCGEFEDKVGRVPSAWAVFEHHVRKTIHHTGSFVKAQ